MLFVETKERLDYNKFDNMSTEALKAVLQADFDAPEAEQLDIDTIMYITNLLTEREKADLQNSAKAVADAKAEFYREYYPLKDNKGLVQNIVGDVEETVNSLANETKYYIFDYFARGNYEIICNESVDVNIVNIYGQSVDKIENNAPYFIKVTNKNSYGLSGNICLKFSPLTVTFGNNNLSNNTEYVQFSPLSTQFYTFNGVTKVYDYNFNLINLSNNQAELIRIIHIIFYQIVTY